MMFRSLVTAVVVMSACVHSFTTPGQVVKRGSALSMKNSDLQRDGKKTAASFLTAAYFFANAISVAPAMAATGFVDFGGSTEIIAGRSGGRAGGRSSYRSSPSRSSYSSPSRSSYSPSRSGTTINRSTTIVQPTRTIMQPMASPMYASPMYASPMYNRGPDLGLVLGLGAVNSIGNGMRENRQENEIMQGRTELEIAKQKNFELEQRLRAVEMKQAYSP